MDQLEISKSEMEIDALKQKKLEEFKVERVQQEEFVYAQKNLQNRTDLSNVSLQVQENKHKPGYDLKQLVLENVVSQSISGGELEKVKENISSDVQLSKDKTVAQEQAFNAPININKNKTEKQDGKVVKKSTIKQEDKGINLQKYLDEVKDKSKGKNKKIDEIVPIVQECRQLVADKNTDLKSMLEKSKKLTEAIYKVNAYLKSTKRIWNNDVTSKEQKDERSLRESVKMLRVQLFLEKMDLYVDEGNGEDDADERKLYEQQLEADALIAIDEEQKKADEQENNQIRDDGRLKSRLKVDEMYKIKLEENLNINDVQISDVKKNIADNTNRAFELQKKLGSKYGLRHKAFSRNEDYQERLNQRIALMKPKIYAKWLDKNLDDIEKNANILLVEITRHPKMFRAHKGEEYFSIDKLKKIFGRDLHAPDMLKEAKIDYELIFNELVRLDEHGEKTKISENFKRLIAAQKVLMEKRMSLSESYEKLIGFNEDEKENFSLSEADKNEEIQKQDEKHNELSEQEENQLVSIPYALNLNEDGVVDALVLKQQTYYRNMVRSMEGIGADADSFNILKHNIEVLLSDNKLHNIEEFANLFFDYVSATDKEALFKNVRLNGKAIADTSRSDLAVLGNTLNDREKFIKAFVTFVTTGRIGDLAESVKEGAKNSGPVIKEISKEEFDRLSGSLEVVTSKELGSKLCRAVKSADNKYLIANANVRLLSDKPAFLEEKLQENDGDADEVTEQAKEALQMIAQQLNKELESEQPKEDDGKISQLAAKQIRTVSKHTIFEQTLKEYVRELEDKKQAGSDREKESDKKKVEELADRILKQFAKEDEKRTGDMLSYQQTALDEQEQEKKKKAADLEFQRNNNEYGLQEMATEERELLKEQHDEMESIWGEKTGQSAQQELARKVNADEKMDYGFMNDEMLRIDQNIEKNENEVQQIKERIDSLNSSPLYLEAKAGKIMSQKKLISDQLEREYLTALMRRYEAYVEADRDILKKIVQEDYAAGSYNYTVELGKFLDDDTVNAIDENIENTKNMYYEAHKAYEQAKSDYEAWMERTRADAVQLSRAAKGMNRIIDYMEENFGEKISEILTDMGYEKEKDEIDYIVDNIKMLDLLDVQEISGEKMPDLSADEEIDYEKMFAEVEEHKNEIQDVLEIIAEGYRSMRQEKVSD